MRDENKGIKKFFVLFIIFLALHLIPTTLFGEERGIRSENISKNQGKFVLKVKGNFISLKAKDASLKDILEEIGRRMKIDVVATIPREQKITIELDMMYLEDALKRFKTNYAYITKSEKRKGEITRIVAIPKGGGKMLPYRFEYNPQPPIQKFEHESKPPIKKSVTEPKPTTQGYSPQTPIQEHEYERRPTTAKPKNEPQSSSSVMKNGSQSSSTVTENESQSSSTVTEDDTQPSNVGFGYNPQPPLTE